MMQNNAESASPAVTTALVQDILENLANPSRTLASIARAHDVPLRVVRAEAVRLILERAHRRQSRD